MNEIIAGDIIEGHVADFASEGEGIIKLNGYPVFVPFAIKGENVRAKVTYAKKDWATAELMDVLAPSAHRVKPRCPYYGKCGGCDLQHIDYPTQLRLKQHTVKTALKKVGGVDVDVPLPISCNEWEYRNKLALPFSYNRHSERISLGFYSKRSHKVTPIKFCPLHEQWAADVIEAVTGWANAYALSVYDEQTHAGLLRHAVARMADRLTLTIVINGVEAPHLDDLYDRLKAKFEDPSLYISENMLPNNVIMGESVRLVYGERCAQKLGRFSAYVSPISFLQTNDKVRDAIYDRTAELLDGFDGEVVELYSGVGLLTAELALRLGDAKFTSVEIERSSYEDAKGLMTSLGIADRVNTVCADALDYIKELVKNKESNGMNSRKILLLDPPRRGCDEALLANVNRLDFESIIYISCNPQTLARDVKLLDGYKLAMAQPYDMFPQTANIEVVAYLERK